MIPEPLDALRASFGLRDKDGGTLGEGLEAFVEPIVDLVDGTTTALELLVRPRSGATLADLDHEAHDRLLPRLSLVVLRLARQVLATSSCRVHVNVTAPDIERPDFATTVLRTISTTHLDRLVVEVTEHLPIRNEEAAAASALQLRASGVALAVDDFGQGWNNLRVLKVLRPDIVKVSLDALRPDDEGADQLARWIVATSRSLGARTIIEQIEDEGQARWARAMGFDAGQGWRWCPRPVQLTRSIDET